MYRDVADIYVHPYTNDGSFDDKTFDELIEIKKTLVGKRWNLENEIAVRTDAPLAVRIDDTVVHLLLERNIQARTNSNKFIWEMVMPLYYRFIINGAIVDNEDLEGQLVYFDFEMFSRYAKKIDDSISRQNIINSYKHGLSLFWFEKEKLKEAGFVLDKSVPSAPEETTDQASAPTEEACIDRPKDEAPTNKVKKKKNGAISAKEAARVLGLSNERSIYRWEANNGEKAPKGYPGRGSATSFYAFASQWKMDNAARREMQRIRTAERSHYSGDNDDE